MKKVIILIITFCSINSFSQTIIMPKHNNTPGWEITYNTCEADFYDSGGQTNTYEFGENGIVTFCPNETNKVIVLNFDFLDIQGNHFLTIYDGDSDNAPILETFTNVLNDSQGYTVKATSTNTSGCLTATFTSGNATYPQIYNGWTASVSCDDPCQTITPSISTSKVIDSDGILKVCKDELIDFNGSAIFSVDDSNATYQWNFGDGSNISNNISITHSFSNSGVFTVELSVTDNFGCEVNKELTVQVSDEPDFTGTTLEPISICLGDTTELIGVANFSSTLPFPQNIVSEQWLPDSSIISSSGNTITVQPQNYRQNCYTYQVTVNSGCVFSKTVCITVKNEIPITQPDNIITCNLNEETAEFNLTTIENQLLNGLNISDYPISYYTNLIDAENLSNPILNPTGYTSISNPQTIYVAIKENTSSCITVINFQIKVIPPNDSLIPSGYNVSVDSDFFAETHQIIATADGNYEYLFSLNDGPFLVSGIFNDVSPGPHNVTIAESNGCGKIVVPIFIIGYPNFFTPNGDGYNDTWNIIENSTLQNTQILIFNRFGKLLTQLDSTSSGWDGIYNGKQLPSDDYWFLIEYEYNSEKKKARGHFALKR